MNAPHSCYIRSRGKILGPFSVEQLQRLRDRGQLRRFHEVSEDRRSWVTAASLTELFPPEVPSLAVSAQSGRPEMDVSLAAMPSPGPEGYQSSGSESESVRDGWRRVRTGLGLLLLSNYIWLGSHVIFLVGMLLMWAAGATASARVRTRADEIGFVESMGVSIAFLVVLWLLCQVAACILQLVGHGFCMGVAPQKKSSVKGLAITVFVLAVTAVVFSVLARMADLVGGFYREGPWTLMGGPFRMPVYLLDVVAFCLFLLFLRSVAAALGKKTLARNVVVLLSSWGGFFAAAVVLFFLLLLAVLDQRGPGGIEDHFRLIGPFAIFILAILGCIGLALYIWFLVVLHQTRNALDRYLSGS